MDLANVDSSDMGMYEPGIVDYAKKAGFEVRRWVRQCRGYFRNIYAVFFTGCQVEPYNLVTSKHLSVFQRLSSPAAEDCTSAYG
ncbi:hypothetical protein LXL04_023014 [Taraxacum kok-saghyz]